jgi:hypothetical protein
MYLGRNRDRPRCLGDKLGEMMTCVRVATLGESC